MLKLYPLYQGYKEGKERVKNGDNERVLKTLVQKSTSFDASGSQM